IGGQENSRGGNSMKDLDWGMDLQLFAEEGQDNEPEEAKEETTEQQETQEEQTEELEETNQVIDKLKERAKKLEIDPLKIQKADEEQLLQMIEDKRVQQAIKTREEKEKKKQKEQEMKQKGEYEQLLKQERQEYLEDYLEAKLESSNLKELRGFIDVSKLLDEDKSDAKEKINTTVSNLSEYVSKTVEERVNEKIKEMEKGSYTSTQKNKESSSVMDSLKNKFS
ncbi:MAG: hypothetical protein ACQESN_11095, partial [Thermotogota bacterium]